MFLSRSPLRITLGGGGTDLPSYYQRFEGHLVAATINKYMYIGANRQFYKTISLKYSEIENVKKLDSIKHPLFREALRYTGLNGGLEITSLADVPSKAGLGGSGAFLVALLNTLYQIKGKTVSKRGLAEAACAIELSILKLHEGKQDKYACSFGGLNSYSFSKLGEVTVNPLSNGDIISSELERHLLLFFTGNIRKWTASRILKAQDLKVKSNWKVVLDGLHRTKELGLESKKALENLDFNHYGTLINEQWLSKLQYAPLSVSPRIKKLHSKGLSYGAIGGKLIGAGGGGFLMFYIRNNRNEFIRKMQKLSLYHMPFSLEKEGVTTLTREN